MDARQHRQVWRRRREIFLAGYSAGGHLVSLLGIDESYLKAEGLNFQSIRGVVSISGVYAPDDLPALGCIFPAKDRNLCFPIAHVKAGGPKFMLFYAEKELFDLDKQARRFHAQMKNASRRIQLHEVKRTDHFEITDEKIVREQYGHRIVTFINEDRSVAKAAE